MKVLMIATIALLCGCDLIDQSEYTLYRSSVTGSNMRVHVATFNADQKQSYNKENCDVAQELFQN